MERIRLLNLSITPQYLFKKTLLIGDAIKFHESIFALPFAYIGMILAADGLPTLHQFLWITIAMVAARTVGMSANRIIDRDIDAKNPRASARHLPAGLLNVTEMVGLIIVSLSIFILAAAQLNTLALILAPVAAAYLIIYPFTKRFTWAANLLLGWALAIAPSAAWIAVQGSLSFEPVLLSLAVAFWAGSFDILYHTQDLSFHLREQLHSVAARFGIITAFRIARVLDCMAVACLVILGAWMELGWPYFLGCVCAICFLIYKYSLVSPMDLSRMGVAFARINGYISTTMLIGTIGSIYA